MKELNETSVRICINTIRSKAAMGGGAVIISREIKSYASKCNYYTLLGSTMNNIY